MRRPLPAPLLLGVLGLAGCVGGTDQGAAPARTSAPTPTPTGYSQEVRSNFLASCLQNAINSARGAANQEQLAQTCECILGQVELEYSESEFADFEKRLLGGKASEQESDRLVSWSTECARGASS